MYTQYLEIAKSLASAAGEIMLKSEKIEVREKSTADFVTNVDISIENMVRENLAKLTPTFAILGEEGAGTSWEVELSQEYCWVLDPLDGTANYAFGIPHYAFSLALLHHGQAVIGVVFDPRKEEMFYAEKGKGAFLNQEQIQVSNKSEIEKSIIAIGLPKISNEYFESNKFWFNTLVSRFAKVRSFGASALDLCWLAAGRIDAFFQIEIKPWDVAAASIICLEAGAKLASIENNKKINFEITAGSIYCSNAELFF